ncbi:hypothetical protein BC941DRAFT_514422 [Chlamydoabsidia padenii]|nr:hypothetical protein BC941DRAFT_514422 [Chlamydoabsidia padenii]
MSSSAISAAKRRTEAALRNYKIPTSSERNEPQDTPKQVLLSLLQSRLIWSSNVFIKYRSDPLQQPKRNNTIRRRFPMMRELGQATLALGPHLFYDTTFYEAIRQDTWLSLGKAANIKGLDIYDHTPSTQDNHEKPATVDANSSQSEDQANKIDTDTQCDIQSTLDSGDGSHDSQQTTQDSNPLPTTSSTGETLINQQSLDCLVFKDIVIEFKDQPNERYIFPKDTIIQVMEGSTKAKCSFMLPLDPECADYFFWDANKKIQHFGDQSSIPEIQQAATAATVATQSNSKSKLVSHQPANIQILDACPAILDTMRLTIYPPDQVRSKMIKQMEKVPDRLYLDYTISKSEQLAIQDLVQRVNTQPDIISGPIAAEKKRNEIGLAIKLGKRPETDQHEAEPPKTKQFIPGKEDLFRKCTYCSTRHTVMWRRGPQGEGTLCNGCGILWLQKKILIDAPVISKQVEWQRNKEKWQIANRKREREEWEENRRRLKESQLSALREEQEAAHRMEMCLRIKKRRAAALHEPSGGPVVDSMASQTYSGSLGLVAAQMVHQQHQQEQLLLQQQQQQHHQQQQQLAVEFNHHHEPLGARSDNTTKPPEAALTQALTTVALPAAIAPSPPTIIPPALKPKGGETPPTLTTTTPSSSAPSYHIFNLPQIPLPTLCIEFTDTMFSHPHCTVSLSHQKQFSIHLTKDNNEPITFDIPKQVLATAVKFEILGQLDSAGRDILLMSCQPQDIGKGPGVPLEGFGSTLYDPSDPSRRLNIRFLEKIDALGGPVVKKILECWLAET